MKALLVCFVAALALVPTAQAKPLTPAQQNRLNVIASWEAGKPVTVLVEGYGAITGSAFMGSDQATLSGPAATLAARGDGIGMFILLHEAWHTQQNPSEDTSTDAHHALECQADREARAHMAPALRKFWPHWSVRRIAWEIAESDRYAPHYVCG